jgi:hypothetical protein
MKFVGTGSCPFQRPALPGRPQHHDHISFDIADNMTSSMRGVQVPEAGQLSSHSSPPQGVNVPGTSIEIRRGKLTISGPGRELKLDPAVFAVIYFLLE